jgi:xylose isomerase
MRSYLIFKEKVGRFNADAEIQDLLRKLRNRGGAAGRAVPLKFSAKRAQKLKEESFDLTAMREQGYAYERLDQLTMELILGVR